MESLEERLVLTTLPNGFSESMVTSGLTRPTAIEFAPDGRLFALEQTGSVELVRSDGSLWTALHLNVDSQGERGLLGIAFDPNYSTNHYVYLYYTNPNAGDAAWATGVHNQLSRFTVDDSNPNAPVFKNEAPILDWNNLGSATNHNGGAIHFGLDGKLYADAGDNVQTFTQNGNTYRVAQTLTNLLGKQLRINVSAFNQGIATRDDTTVGHLIPPDNPFVGTATGINQLIYVLGLRNPYTFAVQPGTGTIYINDVGENTWEEINQSVAGANYGWSGGNTDGFDHSSPPGPGVYHDPLLAYNHNGGPAGGGEAIVGGAFYNPVNAQFPTSYIGKYFYADLSGWIRVFDPSHPGTAANPDTSSAFASGIAGGVIDLDVDSSGSLYYVTGSGAIERVSFNAPQITSQPLSQTINIGQGVAFLTVASGAALHYQWQHLVGMSWINVGSDAATFTITATTSADGGEYRVIVSNAAGTTVSNAAALAFNQTPPPILPGLKAEFFDFTTPLKSLPNLTNLVPDVTRVDLAVHYPATRGAWAGLDSRFIDTFAVRESGFLQVTKNGRYTLSLLSKDGAKLWIDGVLVINNGGIHAPQKRARTIKLAAGFHSIRVEAFANTGVAALNLTWSGPGFKNRLIGADHLFH